MVKRKKNRASSTFVRAGSLALAALATSSSRAELTHILAEEIDNGLDGIRTIQVVAYFNSGLDQVEAVFGNAAQPLELELGGPGPNDGLWNDDLGLGLPLDDTPALGGDYDTWVGFVGDSASFSGIFTPNFWGVPGGGSETSVLQDGVEFLSDTNSAYFIAGGASVDSIDSGGRVVIAQFSVQSTALDFQGGLQYNQGEQMYFDVGWCCLPSPGALPLLGLAAITGRRRRH